MKTRCSFSITLWLPLLAALFFQASDGRAAVGPTLTITPSTVSNTYRGTITWLITGLTNGEPVILQKYLDVNTNGVIDAADILWQQGQLTDGKAAVIGGVTNINVPGDMDTTGGQITARLNFPSDDFSQNIVGKYAFKLSSPGGRFSPLTNLFAITNIPYSQSVTGRVINSGTNVPNAIIIVFPDRPGHGPGDPLGGVVANNSGNYSIPVPAGTYMLLPFKSNYVAYASTVTLSNGATLNTNLTLTNATQSISGKVADAATNSIGLPGLLLHGSASGLFATASSDTNGNFTMRVRPGQWGIGVEGLAAYGYVGFNSDIFIIDTTLGGSNGVIIPCPKATALFYGSLKDDQDHPLVGVYISSHDDPWQYSQRILTDTNGSYVAGALDGQTWSVEIDSPIPPALTNYVFSQGLYGTNLSAGQAVLWNFTAILATNHLTGNVKANGTNIVGVNVSANSTINTVTYQVYGNTDSSGNYALNAANGSWSVSLNCNGPDNSLDGILGSGNYRCPDNQTGIIFNNNASVNFTVYPLWYPLVSQPAQLSATQFGFTLAGAAGTNYTVQASTNLASTNWSTLLITNPPSDSAFLIQDNMATNKQRFYRVKVGL